MGFGAQGWGLGEDPRGGGGGPKDPSGRGRPDPRGTDACRVFYYLGCFSMLVLLFCQTNKAPNTFWCLVKGPGLGVQGSGGGGGPKVQSGRDRPGPRGTDACRGFSVFVNHFFCVFVNYFYWFLV